MTTDVQQKIYSNFKSLINLSAQELKEWLATDSAKSVGWTESGGRKTSPDGPKSIGYQSGEAILHILQTPQEQLDPSDYKHMQRVIAYIRRHTAQVPTKQALETSRWRYSLMNWGHDPLKPGSSKL
jgi:hypothetical protein